MPVSLEQWRASVGLNNAARSRVLNKLGGKRPAKDLLSQFGLLLLRLVAGVFGFSVGEGECCSYHTFKPSVSDVSQNPDNA